MDKWTEEKAKAKKQMDSAIGVLRKWNPKLTWMDDPHTVVVIGDKKYELGDLLQGTRKGPRK